MERSGAEQRGEEMFDAGAVHVLLVREHLGGWHSFCVVSVTIKKGTRNSFCLCFVGDNIIQFVLGEPRINIL